MTPELTALALAALLQIGQLALYSVAGQAQAGTGAALKPRDEPIELTGKAGRIKRAMDNHFEGLILFAIAVLVLAMADKSGPVTILCSWLYLAARVLYIPAYIFGWVPWRSLIWLVGLAATVMLLLTALTWQG
ncbi:MAPEG family protein [Pseudooceanicola sp.]|uniref:MAPEG family protein n=1 Tax=Pseudooceanicola sp. TaxID=1914328 RepID=UPI004059592A